jgi:hypothetical protein
MTLEQSKVRLALSQTNRTLPDAVWTTILRRIREGKCTPFLGAGASHPTLPLGAQIAREWAREYQYPMRNEHHDLARVAQYRSVIGPRGRPKEDIRTLFAQRGLPDFSDPSEPHRVLAELPLPVYVTTN